MRELLNLIYLGNNAALMCDSYSHDAAHVTIDVCTYCDRPVWINSMRSKTSHTPVKST